MASSVHERLRELRIRCPSDGDEQRCFVFYNGRKLVGLVSDARVMSNGDPAFHRGLTQPDIVRASRRKVIGVSLYANSRVAEDGGELQTTIAVGEENNTQAARS